MASVTFTYNGTDTIIAVITGATPGNTYSLSADDPASSREIDVASSSILVLKNTSIGGFLVDFAFSSYVADETTDEVVGGTVLYPGQTDPYEANATWEYDGVNTIQVTWFAEVGVDYRVQAWDWGTTPPDVAFTGAGALHTTTFVAPGAFAGQFVGQIYIRVPVGGSYSTTGFATRLFDQGVEGAGQLGSPQISFSEGFESGLGDWATNGVIATSTEKACDLTHSLKVTTSATNGPYALSPAFFSGQFDRWQYASFSFFVGDFADFWQSGANLDPWVMQWGRADDASNITAQGIWFEPSSDSAAAIFGRISTGWGNVGDLKENAWNSIVTGIYCDSVLARTYSQTWVNGSTIGVITQNSVSGSPAGYVLLGDEGGTWPSHTQASYYIDSFTYQPDSPPLVACTTELVEWQYNPTCEVLQATINNATIGSVYQIHTSSLTGTSSIIASEQVQVTLSTTSFTGGGRQLVWITKNDGGDLEVVGCTLYVLGDPDQYEWPTANAAWGYDGVDTVTCYFTPVANATYNLWVDYAGGTWVSAPVFLTSGTPWFFSVPKTLTVPGGFMAYITGNTGTIETFTAREFTEGTPGSGSLGNPVETLVTPGWPAFAEVGWEYDGASVLVAHVRGAVIGRKYFLYSDDFDSNPQEVVAVEENFDITISDIGGVTPGYSFIVKLDDITGRADLCATTIFVYGQTSPLHADAIWTYDGVNTVTVQFLSEVGVYYQIGKWGRNYTNGDDVVGDGTVKTLSVTSSTQTCEIFQGLLYNDQGVEGYSDVLNRLFYEGLSNNGIPGNPGLPPEATVTFSYDGADPGTVLIRVYGAVIGHTYEYYATDPTSGYGSYVATEENFILTISDVGGFPLNFNFDVNLLDATTLQWVAGTVFTQRSPVQYASDAVWTYDGDTTVSVTFTSGAGLWYAVDVYDGNQSNNPTPVQGTGGLLTITVDYSPVEFDGSFAAFLYYNQEVD